MRIVDKLAKVGSDKFLHLLACQVIAFVAAYLESLADGRYIGAAMGFVVAMAVGIVKEMTDKSVDKGDLVADFIGAVTGALYFLI